MEKVAVYACTRNLYDMMKTAVTSLLAHVQMDRVYLLIEDDSFPHKMPEEVITVNISGQKFFPEDGANYHTKWTYAAFIRVALAKMFPEEKMMLWLDCDTIVDDDISELFKMDMTGYYFAGIREYRKGDYINTGVLMLNLEAIRRDKIDDLLIETINTQRMELPDQDAINMIGKGHIRFLRSDYNVCSFTEPPEKMKIYHYAGREIYNNDPLFRKYSGIVEPPRILIAVPCMEMVHADFMRCMMDMQKTENTSYTLIKNTLIYNARNVIAQNAIRYGFDRVMWLDSDIKFEPDTLLKLSEDLDKGYDFVSGVYYMRTLPPKPVLYSEIIYNVRNNEAETGAKRFSNYPKDQIFEIAGSGFGCVMTSVMLLKKLVERFGAPFTPMMGLGEDVAFCYRAQQIGAKLFCDSRIKCGHIGSIVYDEYM